MHIYIYESAPKRQPRQRQWQTQTRTHKTPYTPPITFPTPDARLRVFGLNIDASSAVCCVLVDDVDDDDFFCVLEFTTFDI